MVNKRRHAEVVEQADAPDSKSDFRGFTNRASGLNILDIIK
ncbi:MAG: hypothetical protein NTX75_04015 [Proteobacteria bacterium]|nr:hypothetical protein [Pseudomonadota bacterium]